MEGSGEEWGEQEPELVARRASLGLTLGRLGGNVVSYIARTVGGVGELIVDSELRRRGASAVGNAVGTAAAAAARGLQQGAGTIAAGPRTVQGILQKLQQRIEEQRMQALLLEQRDAPVDVQVGGGPQAQCCCFAASRSADCASLPALIAGCFLAV